MHIIHEGLHLTVHTVTGGLETLVGNKAGDIKLLGKEDR